MEEPAQISEIPAPPPPDPRLVAVQDAVAGLAALVVEQLPDTDSRTHALAHARAVAVYAGQAIREGG